MEYEGLYCILYIVCNVLYYIVLLGKGAGKATWSILHLIMTGYSHGHAETLELLMWLQYKGYNYNHLNHLDQLCQRLFNQCKDPKYNLHELLPKTNEIMTLVINIIFIPPQKQNGLASPS